jgi:hypothetical protein
MEMKFERDFYNGKWCFKRCVPDIGAIYCFAMYGVTMMPALFLGVEVLTSAIRGII